MGQQQSKSELLYQQVNYANIEGIKALHSEGASLEWTDREGKTPLMAACLNLDLYNVAKTLIELGANVNAYRPGGHAGTPLHHAAKRGLEPTVKLLLMNGANVLMMNDNYQTPLDIARAKGYSNIVRTIENHICLFSGWLREFYGPGFLEILAPQLVSRKVWVVVLPCGSRNPMKPFKLELAIYSNFQDAKPRTVIALWKANLEDPKIHELEPTVTIVDNSSISRGRRRRRNVSTYQERRCRPQTLRQTHIKLAPANETDKQQLQWFADACKGIPQAMHPAFLHSTQAQVPPATAPSTVEDLELPLANSAPIQSSSAADISPHVDALSITEASASSSRNHSVDTCEHGGSNTPTALAPSKASGSDWTVHEAGPSGNLSQTNNIHAAHTTLDDLDSIPSAPPLTNEIVEDGPVHYPSIDSSPVDISSPVVESIPCSSGTSKEGSTSSSSCVICLDAPVEGACVPCGHMAGCMSCLSEIKAKKWGCPVCRAQINQIIRLYAV